MPTSIVSQFRQQGGNTILAGDLLFGSSGQDQVEGECLVGIEVQKGRDEGDERAPGIITAQAIEQVPFTGRSKGIALPATGGFNGIVMGVQQDGRSIRLPALIPGPDIIAGSLHRYAPVLQKGKEQGSRFFFRSGEGWRGNKLLQ